MFFSWASTAATRTQQAADSPRSHEIDDPFVPGDVALKADLLQLFGTGQGKTRVKPLALIEMPIGIHI